MRHLFTEYKFSKGSHAAAVTVTVTVTCHGEVRLICCVKFQFNVLNLQILYGNDSAHLVVATTLT